VPEGRFRLHEDAVYFREAVAYTAAETGFSTRLIEKDYFASVVLHELVSGECGLVFKGGTCLAKVHLGFYRLSEDLDFLIPVPLEASRNERSVAAGPAKCAFDEVPKLVPGLRIADRLAGANESWQYLGTIAYESLLDGHRDSIKVEIGLREPLLSPVLNGRAQTLLRDPVTGDAMLAAFSLPCLSWDESMAEKLRAALSRREPAIRDLYDVHHAVVRRGLNALEPELVALVRTKLAVPGNRLIPFSDQRQDELRAQLNTRLRPVLRDPDFAEFDQAALERVLALVENLAAALA
jgi:predicted nucleotidyltransferase component of viral defense system